MGLIIAYIQWLAALILDLELYAIEQRLAYALELPVSWNQLLGKFCWLLDSKMVLDV
jgi:hypothetical protein